MYLEQSRRRPEEQERIRNLLAMATCGGESVLDVGARDGYISTLLASTFNRVFALDLRTPSIQHSAITCIEGDVTALQLPDCHFDTVVCAEVLEHVPPPKLARACDELARVARRDVIIGVPYDEDTRVGRTTCSTCGKTNPPYGHVNRFNEHSLISLFPTLRVEQVSFVGDTVSRTTTIGAILMNLAGNPYGTYEQEEPCGHCSAKLVRPIGISVWQRFMARIACTLARICERFASPQPIWIHVHFKKPMTNPVQRSRN